MYRKFTFPGFFDNLIKSLEITVLIMFLVAASNFFGAEFSSLGTPKMMTESAWSGHVTLLDPDLGHGPDLCSGLAPGMGSDCVDCCSNLVADV